MRAYLGGARGTALEKTSKTGSPDVRPLCAGEALRRLVGKALLRSELPTLRAHLLPHQLAVGVPAGAEVMPHLHRQWRQHYQSDMDRVCLSYDEGNAHNVVDRHVFLTRMQEVAPGLSRWLEYIYPTNLDTKVFYHNIVIPSAAGGQQGCPLMAACHAVVQRLLLESLGLIDPPPGTAVALPTLQPPVQLDMAPCFADDGLLAGPSAEVLRALQHWSSVLPLLGLRLSQASVAPAAGRAHQVNFQPFLAMGCTLCEDANYEVLKSPVGEVAFCQAYCLERAATQASVLQLVGGLDDPQVAYYLLRWCCTGGRMNYMARTTPLRCCEAALQAYDGALQEAFQASTGLTLEVLSWKQAQLPVGSGGLGLRPAATSADAAFIGSQVMVLERCQALWPGAQWTGGDVASDLGQALARCNGVLQAAGLQPLLGSHPDNHLTQSAIARRLRPAHLKDWRAGAGTDDLCRLHACSAASAETVLNLTPSHILDTNLTKDDFLTMLGGRLGVDVCLGGGACRFCGLAMDAKGRHANSCMAGGDAVAVHNAVRDLVHDYCARAQLRPQAEAPGLLDGRRRPADILLRAATGMLAPLPDGSRPVGPGALALDVAVINSLGPSHWDDTLKGPHDAVTAYASRKRQHLDTASQCLQVGIHYQPMVWDIHGGSTPETRAVMHRLAGLVALVEGDEVRRVYARMADQVATVLARGAGRALRRRRKVGGHSSATSGLVHGLLLDS